MVTVTIAGVEEGTFTTTCFISRPQRQWAKTFENLCSRSLNLTQIDLAQRFQGLHSAPELLVLPNAWDAGSAVIFEKAGFNAVGSTSAGIAYSLGYPDGERLSFQELLAAQARIVRRISVPLSMDIEAGYGVDVEAVLHTVEQVVAAGAVGINLEDGRNDRTPHLADLRTQCELLASVRGLEETTGVPFVVNARTDGFWLGLGDADEQLESAVQRGNAYLEAGAHCVFVPGSLSREMIRTLVQEIDGPVNLIATSSSPAPRELEDLGVARLSLGSGPARASLSTIRQIARDVRAGSLASLSGIDMTYDEANRLFDS